PAPILQSSFAPSLQLLNSAKMTGYLPYFHRIEYFGLS
ncbi:MAG: hypothetical protein ACI97B_002215, partial [Verrucomicrobiales bacterium]